jgi:hypothetical protein
MPDTSCLWTGSHVACRLSSARSGMHGPDPPRRTREASAWPLSRDHGAPIPTAGRARRCHHPTRPALAGCIHVHHLPLGMGCSPAAPAPAPDPLGHGITPATHPALAPSRPHLGRMRRTPRLLTIYCPPLGHGIGTKKWRVLSPRHAPSFAQSQATQTPLTRHPPAAAAATAS